MTVWTALWQ